MGSTNKTKTFMKKTGMLHIINDCARFHKNTWVNKKVFSTLPFSVLLSPRVTKTIKNACLDIQRKNVSTFQILLKFYLYENQLFYLILI